MIAFSSYTSPEELFNLYLMAADGTSLRQLTSDEGWEDEPLWSPDGSEIVFRTERGRDLDLAVIPVEGGPVRLLTESPEDEGRPQWAEGGRTLVFEATPWGNELVGVEVSRLLEGR